MGFFNRRDHMADWYDGYQVWLSEEESLHNALIVANHLSGGDWSRESISALIGNMRAESSVNPNMYEMGYDWSADRGFGLLQWTPRSKYWNWAESEGLPPRAGESQLARLDYEVQNNIQWIANRLSTSPPYPPGLSSYGGSFTDFRTNKDDLTIAELTEAFMWNYEAPAYSAATDSLPTRIAFANKVSNLDFEGGTPGKIVFMFPATTNVTSPFRPPHRPDHNGVDFSDGKNEPIHASAGGVVTRSYLSDSFGEVIYIDHDINGERWTTIYAHMVSGSRKFKAGDLVNQGDVLGIMGTTGQSTGIHLHFEMHKGGYVGASSAVDPMLYLGIMKTEPEQKRSKVLLRQTNMRRMGVRGRAR